MMILPWWLFLSSAQTEWNHKSTNEAAVNLNSKYMYKQITVQKPLWKSESINLCMFLLFIFRTQTMWSQSETLWRTTARCSVFTKVTSSGCRLWTAWRRVRHHGACQRNPVILLSESMIRKCLCVFCFVCGLQVTATAVWWERRWCF